MIRNASMPTITSTNKNKMWRRKINVFNVGADETGRQGKTISPFSLFNVQQEEKLFHLFLKLMFNKHHT